MQDEYAFTAEFYDQVPPYRDRADVSFYVEAAKEYKGPVLEIACGTGRILIPTARAGVSIVGIDLSEHMLTRCREKSKAESPDVQSRIKLHLADMRQFDLGTSFSLVTMPFRPFQHLVSVEDQISCLRTAHRHLHHAGLLILDLFNPSLEMLVADNLGQERGPDCEFTMEDGRKVARYSEFVSKDHLSQVNDTELIYYVTHPDGRKEKLVHRFQMRYFFRYEVEHLLERCGFHLEHIYADFDKSAYGSKYPGELILVARKR
jgi:SAM-dependent methyltransferase